jgi:Flp pilus assembly protein TadD
MRAGPLLLVLLLAACGHTQSDVSGLTPGIDVAQAALRGGSPQTALQLAGNVLARDPVNEAALVIQGDALTDLGRVDEARASYNLALKSNGASVGADVGLGRLSLGNDPAGAAVLFLQALTHDPRNTTALNDLGVARDLMGDHAGAQTAYRQALGIDPQDSAAQVNLALSMAMSGSADDAVRILRPMASDPGASNKLRHDLAAALTMAGDRDEAARILSKDLTPEQVRQALDDYAAARSGRRASAVLASTGGTEAAVALTPAQAATPATGASPAAEAATAPVSTPAATAAPTQAQAPASSPTVASNAAAAPTSSAATASTAAAAPNAATASTSGTTVAAASTSSATATAAAAPAGAPIITSHVQLAAVGDQDAARAEWRRLKRKMPALLSDHQPIFIRQTTPGGHTVWLVRAGGFPNQTEAGTFCQQVRAAGSGCFVEAQ